MLRMAASLAAAGAIAASLAGGAWQAMPKRRVEPPRKPPIVRKHPAVTASALRRGCEAWGEDVATCLAPGEATFTWSSEVTRR